MAATTGRGRPNKATATMQAAPSPSEAGDYARHKEAARHRQAAMSRAGRDIAPVPPVADPARREACRMDFRRFCETYFSSTFCLAWSPDHLKVIAKTEQAVLRGGLFALAMPRGSGKTCLSEAAALWAVLYGHRRFVFIIGSDQPAAESMLDSIKTEIETNELLADDFPAVCYPVQKMDGINQRAQGQICNGKRTRISWKGDEIILPTIDGSEASGAIMRIAGITGRIRGAKFKRPDGKTVRPDLVIPDDPQTDESARSLSQCATRERVLAGAVLGLAGPGAEISGIMPCTVISPGDMADRILNRDIHPEWNGERCKLMYELPDEAKPRPDGQPTLWDRYAEIRADCLRRTGHADEATEFYRKNRDRMDSGAVVAWEQRHKPDELSAVQNCMNLRLTDIEAFSAEYQNDPMQQTDDAIVHADADDISGRLNGRAQGVVPNEATLLTAAIDVQDNSLWWVVCAWSEDFTGYVVDYGTYPKMPSRYFQMAQMRRTLKTEAPTAGLEGRIYAGLERLTAEILGPWTREDGHAMPVDRCLIDANWGESTPVVYRFAKESSHAAIITPCHGRSVGAGARPWTEMRPQKGERAGLNWRMPPAGKRDIRYCLIDTNFWKSFLMARLGVAIGDSGGLSLPGRDQQHHRLLAEHLCAEYRQRIENKSTGRTVDEWRHKPGRPDNHWLDALCYCAVAASMSGASLSEHAKERSRRESRGRRSVSFADARKQRAGGRQLVRPR